MNPPREPDPEPSLDFDPIYFNPQGELAMLDRDLPHWYQDKVTTFVTFRLADSLPQKVLRQWSLERQLWLEAHPEPRSPETSAEYHQLFPDRLNTWLDAGMGSCILADPFIGNTVSNALQFFEGTRYRLGEWVVMPNHVHAIVHPMPGYQVGTILHSWKSFTANKINALRGLSGSVWQRESFDHLVRSPGQLWHITNYIRENPKKARLSHPIPQGPRR